MKMDKVLPRVVLLLLGLVIAHLGVTLFLVVELGSDPFNVFIQGLFKVISGHTAATWITHGRVHMAVSLLIILILLVLDRSYIRIGTVLCMVCGGPIIDFFTKLLTPLALQEAPLWVRIAVNCIGCVILAYGMTVVITSEAGTGPNDLVAVVISDREQLLCTQPDGRRGTEEVLVPDSRLESDPAGKRRSDMYRYRIPRI